MDGNYKGISSADGMLSVKVPEPAMRTGKKINPCFLYDNQTYVLGVVPHGKHLTQDPSAYHEKFKKYHLEAEAQVNHPAYSA